MSAVCLAFVRNPSKMYATSSVLINKSRSVCIIDPGIAPAMVSTVPEPEPTRVLPSPSKARLPSSAEAPSSVAWRRRLILLGVHVPLPLLTEPTVVGVARVGAALLAVV